MKLYLDEGKYTITIEGAEIKAYRYGEEYRDFAGDKFIYSLVMGSLDKSLEIDSHLTTIDVLLKALCKVSEWPDGGSDYGQKKIKVFAKSVLEDIGYVCGG